VAPPAAAVGALAQSNTQIAAAETIGAIAELQTVVQSAGGFVEENAATDTVVYQAATPAGMTVPLFALKDVVGDDRALVSIDAAGAVRLLAAANFEAKPSYRFTVVASQEGQATVETAVTVQVTDINEAPAALALSATTVAENLAAGTVIGTLSAVDPDGDVLTYALVSGDGSADNAAFTIEGNQLRAAATFNFEVRNTYAIRVRATDPDGLVTEAPFTISVTDADEPLLVEAVTQPAAGVYPRGGVVRFTVTLSEAVAVRGKPQIEVRAGSAIRKATYVGAEGPAVLTFEYRVGKKDVADAVSLGRQFLFPKKSAITADGEKLAKSLPEAFAGAVAQGVRIDARPAQVRGRVGVPANATYTVGQSLDFLVSFSEAVLVSGTPQLALNGFNGGARQATYVSGSGTEQVTFRYVIQAGDTLRGKKGPKLGKVIALPDAATITDEAGNRGPLKIKAPPMKGIRIDAPAVAASLAPASVEAANAPKRSARAAAFAALG
jgi:hypothetical protein